MAESPLGAALSSFSTAYSRQKQTTADRAQRDEDNRYRREALRYGYDGYQGDMGAGYDTPNGRASGPTSPDTPMAEYTGRVTPMNDPASSSMPAYQRAFLNTIADGESNGAYDVRYSAKGGVSFDPESGHPRIFEPTKDGRKSSAAGRYQFTWTTWKGLMGEDAPFTPENQDRAAWMLAQRDYRAHTGRDISADLQNGTDITQIMSTLGPTWQAFTNRDQLPRYAATYADSLQRYSDPPAGARGVGHQDAPQPQLSFGQEVAQNVTTGLQESPIAGIIRSLAQ